MKIQVICEKCGKIAELKPINYGQYAYMNKTLIENSFYVSDVSIECSSSDNVEHITDFDDISIEKELKEIRIDCSGCGEYIVLTDFGL